MSDVTRLAATTLGRCVRDDHIDLARDQLSNEAGRTVVTAFGPAILHREIAALDPAAFAQPLHQCSGVTLLHGSRIRPQKSDNGGLSWLCAERFRYRQRR
jgi:hypothetical protein